MDHNEQDGNDAPEALPPPPPVPSNVTPLKAETEAELKKVFRVPMARRGLGTRGNKVPILTNHFKVNVNKVDGHFFHYSVCQRCIISFSIPFPFALEFILAHPNMPAPVCLICRLPFFMKMTAPLTARVLAGKCLTESMRHMKLSWVAKNLHMMERRPYSLLVHFHGTNSSLLLCLMMSHLVGMFMSIV